MTNVAEPLTSMTKKLRDPTLSRSWHHHSICEKIILHPPSRLRQSSGRTEHHSPGRPVFVYLVRDRNVYPEPHFPALIFRRFNSAPSPPLR